MILSPINFLNYLTELSDNKFKRKPIEVSDLQVLLCSMRNASPVYDEIPIEEYKEYLFCLAQLIT